MSPVMKPEPQPTGFCFNIAKGLVSRSIQRIHNGGPNTNQHLENPQRAEPNGPGIANSAIQTPTVGTGAMSRSENKACFIRKFIGRVDPSTPQLPGLDRGDGIKEHQNVEGQIVADEIEEEQLHQDDAADGRFDR